MIGLGGRGGELLSFREKSPKRIGMDYFKISRKGAGYHSRFFKIQGGGAGLLFSLTQKKPVNLEARKNCSISYRLFFEKMMGLGRGRGGNYHP